MRRRCRRRPRRAGRRRAARPARRRPARARPRRPGPPPLRRSRSTSRTSSRPPSPATAVAAGWVGELSGGVRIPGGASSSPTRSGSPRRSTTSSPTRSPRRGRVTLRAGWIRGRRPRRLRRRRPGPGLRRGRSSRTPSSASSRTRPPARHRRRARPRARGRARRGPGRRRARDEPRRRRRRGDAAAAGASLRGPRRAQPVARAADGLERGAPERPVELLAQVADVDLDHVGAVARSPCPRRPRAAGSGR